MGASGREAVTRLVMEAPGLDDASLDRLVTLLYGELHELARGTLAPEPHDCTLSTTTLLHETYLRLVDAPAVSARGRAYFFASAARAMRRVLVDHARRRGRLKRGGGASRVRLEEARLSADGSCADVLEVHEALDRLAEINPRAARVVEGRFFGGLSLEETARGLGVSERTAKRDWAFARAWLFREIGGGD